MALFDQYMIDFLGLVCDRLLGQFGQSTTGIQPMLDAMATQTQDWNNITKTVFDGRFLENAEGVQLDIIGQIVGQERPFIAGTLIPYFTMDTSFIDRGWDGLAGWFTTNAPLAGLIPASDAIYRSFLRGKIFKNQVTGGSIPEMMQFIKLTLNINTSIKYVNWEPLAYMIMVPVGLSEVFINFLLGQTSDNTVENSYNIPTPVATRLVGIMSLPEPVFNFDVENANKAGWDNGKWAVTIPA